MRTLRKAAIVTILITQLILVGTAACASPTEPQPGSENSSPSYDTTIYGNLREVNPRGQVVIYWHDFTEVQEEQQFALVDEFNRTNEWKITILTESQGTNEALYDRLNKGLSTGKGPGLIVASPEQALTYARTGAFVSVDPYVESDTWGFARQEITDFYPIALNSDYIPELQGRYGWPIFKDMEVLYYNEDWRVELGYDKLPEAWEVFEEMTCAASTQSFSNFKGEGASWGFEYPAHASQFTSLIFGMGGDITNKGGTAFVFNSEEGFATLSLLRSLQTDDCATLLDDTASRIVDFGEGRVLFLIAPVHQLADIWDAVDRGAGFNWSVSPVPHSTDQPRMNIFGPSVSVLKTSPENQLAAWLFARWLSEPAQQARWAASTGYLPVRRSSAKLLTDYLTTHPNYAKALSYMGNQYGTQLPSSAYNQCQTFIGGMLTAVAAGGDIQGELDATLEQCTRLLQ